MPVRFLLISAGVGGGHVRAAQALEKAFARHRPQDEVRHVDALDFVTDAMRAAYVVPYLNLVNFVPELWGYLYKRSSEKGIDSKTSRIRSIATKVNSGKLKKLIGEYRPDHILATHFLPLDALTTKGGARKWPSIPVTTVITDYAVHSFWLRAWVDRYFVATDECAAALTRRGFDRSRVQVTGLPTDPAFSEAAARLDAVDRLSSDEGSARPAGRPLGFASEGGRQLRVLLMGGGFGVGHMVEAARAILGIRTERGPGRAVHLTAVAGRNEETRVALEALAVPPIARLKVLGFIDDVQEEMARADVLVSKAGGLTVTEALVMGLPMLLLDPIPGQEEHNADLLLEEGAAKKVGSLDSLEFKLDRALRDPGWLARMRERARAIRRPHAARDILEAAATIRPRTHLEIGE